MAAKARARVAHRQARPGREVLGPGRRVGAGVAAGELGQRGVAVRERAGRAEPVVRERVGRLASRASAASITWPSAAALITRWIGRLRIVGRARWPAARDVLGDLVAGARAVRDRGADGRGRIRRADAHLLAAPAPAREPDRPEQRHQPARVLGRDEVQRPAHAPDPGDGALLEAGRGRPPTAVAPAQPRAHAEGRRGRVLGLQSADQPHDLVDRCAPSSRSGPPSRWARTRRLLGQGREEGCAARRNDPA